MGWEVGGFERSWGLRWVEGTEKHDKNMLCEESYFQLAIDNKNGVHVCNWIWFSHKENYQKLLASRNYHCKWGFLDWEKQNK